MLIAISAAHGRHEVTMAWAEHTASLGFDLVIVACTPGDALNIWGCQDAGLPIVRWPNEPLSGKFNKALEIAMKEGATRIMILPSDDFVSPAWVEAARTSTEDYMYPHSCAIVDAASQQAYNITKLSFGTLKYGAGRVVSRKVVEACGGQLWPSELNKGLDGASHQRITRAGFPVKVVETEGIPITDLKSYSKDKDGKLVSNNIWPASTWQSSGCACTIDQALHMCNASVRAKIDAMRNNFIDPPAIR